jgi:hypothetical protein
VEGVYLESGLERIGAGTLIVVNATDYARPNLPITDH